MAQCKGASIHIQFALIRVQLLGPGKGYRCEGLINLKDIDIIQGKACFFQNFRGYINGPREHDLRVGPYDCIRDKAHHRIQFKLFYLVFAHKHHRRRAVRNGARYSGRYPFSIRQDLEGGKRLMGCLRSDGFIRIPDDLSALFIDTSNGQDFIFEIAIDSLSDFARSQYSCKLL